MQLNAAGLSYETYLVTVVAWARRFRWVDTSLLMFKFRVVEYIIAGAIIVNFAAAALWTGAHERNRIPMPMLSLSSSQLALPLLGVGCFIAARFVAKTWLT